MSLPVLLLLFNLSFYRHTLYYRRTDLVLLFKFMGAHDITGTLNCSCVLYLTLTLMGAHYITGTLNCSCVLYLTLTLTGAHYITGALSCVLYLTLTLMGAHYITGVLVYYVLNASLLAHFL